jgi:hypothetical protein
MNRVTVLQAPVSLLHFNGALRALPAASSRCRSGGDASFSGRDSPRPSSPCLKALKAHNRSALGGGAVCELNGNRSGEGGESSGGREAELLGPNYFRVNPTTDVPLEADCEHDKLIIHHITVHQKGSSAKRRMQQRAKQKKVGPWLRQTAPAAIAGLRLASPRFVALDCISTQRGACLLHLYGWAVCFFGVGWGGTIMLHFERHRGLP